MSNILVTGGAGYIGSHTCVELLERGDDVVVVDSLVNSSPRSLEIVQELTGRRLTFVEADLNDRARLDQVFSDNAIDAVIHFAALKAVGESVEQPVRYYQNNLGSTFVLLEAMATHGVHDLVFSSSATVYGEPEVVPIPESAPVGPTNPYGHTKLMIEQILTDAAVADPALRVGLLRYFNPVGAHPSGRIGEDPSGRPNNLMPFVMQVAVGRRAQLSIFGDDYDTPDGTGVRDYLHVVDLAQGHLAALNGLERKGPGAHIWNLGTGNGASVLDLVNAVGEVVGHPIPYEVVSRRPGDAAIVVADPTLANDELNWAASRTLEEMCADSWRWQSTNPNGFSESD